MENKPLPTEFSWENVRLISFNEAKITLLLRGEEELRVYTFSSPEEMRAQVDVWFGKAAPSAV
jgi:hypothetical protein